VVDHRCHDYRIPSSRFLINLVAMGFCRARLSISLLTDQRSYLLMAAGQTTNPQRTTGDANFSLVQVFHRRGVRPGILQPRDIRPHGAHQTGHPCVVHPSRTGGSADRRDVEGRGRSGQPLCPGSGAGHAIRGQYQHRFLGQGADAQRALSPVWKRSVLPRFLRSVFRGDAAPTPADESRIRRDHRQERPDPHEQSRHQGCR
jgi:hypothetical protein